jgi:predicted nucleic acid-binding protein
VASQVCLDASFALKLVLSEPESEEVEAQWEAWLRGGVDVISPYLLLYEISSVLRNHAYQKKLTEKEAEAALKLVTNLGIIYLSPQALWQLAWDLASRFNRPTLYDCYYLALAQHQSCPFWTGDKRLYNAVRMDLDWVHCVSRR